VIAPSAHDERVVAGRRLEIRTIAGTATTAPILMLHEGLGSVSAWRDFPDQLAERTQRSVVVVSRYGHGRSEPLRERRAVDYMHAEAEKLVPLIGALGLERPVLFGHSDGASIALLFAATHPHAVRALVLEAPHVFVEPLTVESIARVRDTVAETSLVEKLARHHDDAAGMFWGWNDIWLDPAFLAWNITAGLDAITAPTLLIQGRDDEYGSLAQLDAIAAAVPNVDQLIFERSGHSPHRTQTAAVLERTSAFLATIS
jgi:pimeloyl-ACP methyl ester carboxylesterase